MLKPKDKDLPLEQLAANVGYRPWVEFCLLKDERDAACTKLAAILQAAADLQSAIAQGQGKELMDGTNLTFDDLREAKALGRQEALEELGDPDENPERETVRALVKALDIARAKETPSC